VIRQYGEHESEKRCPRLGSSPYRRTIRGRTSDEFDAGLRRCGLLSAEYRDAMAAVRERLDRSLIKRTKRLVDDYEISVFQRTSAWARGAAVLESRSSWLVI